MSKPNEAALAAARGNVIHVKDKGISNKSDVGAVSLGSGESLIREVDWQALCRAAKSEQDMRDALTRGAGAK